MGTMAFTDEYRYCESISAVKRIILGDVIGFCRSLSSTTGRPGDATLRILPALIQGILYKLGIPTNNPCSLMVNAIFNAIVSLLLLIYFYKITLILFPKNYNIALLSIIIYGFLANSNIYIRHILPYDLSLFIFIYTLYLALGAINSIKIYLLSGALAGLGFAVYPGYYFFPLLIFITLLHKNGDKSLNKEIIFKLLYFILATLLIIGFYELIARLGGVSYLMKLKEIAGAITQGSFQESFLFLPKYLIKVEKFIGVFLLIFIILYILEIIVAIVSRKIHILISKQPLHLLIITAIAGYLMHASSAYTSHKMVFYSRLVHMYFPFLIWASVYMITEFNKQTIKNCLFMITICLSCLSFLTFLFEYYKISYPIDTLYKYGIDTQSISSTNIIYETTTDDPLTSPGPWNRLTNFPYQLKNYILVNFCYFYPLHDDFKEYVPQCGTKLIYKKPHFLTFPAYTFEMYNIEERIKMAQRRYQVKIYRIEKE
jgi:hypothetical protein